MSAGVRTEPMITAPVYKGMAFGQVLVELQGEEVAEAPLVALGSVDEGGLWSRMVDSMLLWLE